jgi:hypothetical protein
MDRSCVECGYENDENFAIYNPAGSGEVRWVCQKHGQDGFDGDMAAEFLPDGRFYALERAETDSCEANTPGCSVRHQPGDVLGCEVW